jgi:hypothetical protein
MPMMRKIAHFAPAAAALLAAAAHAGQGGWTSDRALDRVASEARRACGGLAIATPGFLAQSLAGLTESQACPHRPELAFRLAEAMAANRWHAADGHQLLAELHRRGLGTPASAAAADEHLRRAWLLVAPGAMERPFPDPAEARQWLARGETIDFLRRHSAHDGQAIRARLAQALLARGGPGDEAEARRILASPEVAGSSVARLLQARFDLAAPDEATRAAALREIRSAARSGYDWGDAADLIAELAGQRLAAATSPGQRQEAIALLADAAFAPGSPHRDAFFIAVRNANGGAEPASVPSDEAAALRQALRAQLGSIDYPAAALRAEEQGRVSLRGLVDPAGRIIFTEPLSADQPPRLVAGTRRHFAQRQLPPVELGAARRGRYLWIELPALFFRLPAD